MPQTVQVAQEREWDEYEHEYTEPGAPRECPIRRVGVWRRQVVV